MSLPQRAYNYSKQIKYNNPSVQRRYEDIAFQYISVWSLKRSLNHSWAPSQAAPKQHQKFTRKGTFFALPFLTHKVHLETVGRRTSTYFSITSTEGKAWKRTVWETQGNCTCQKTPLKSRSTSWVPGSAILLLFVLPCHDFSFDTGYPFALTFCTVMPTKNTTQGKRWRKIGGVFHAWETGWKLVRT